MRRLLAAAVLGLALVLSTGCTPAQVETWWAYSQVGHAQASYSAGGFWCARYVDWVETRAHVAGWRHEDGPAAIYADHQATLSQVPHEGDIVFVDLTDGTQPGAPVTHVGIVTQVDGDGTVTTAEGNADPAPQVVTVHRRHAGDGYVVAFSAP